MYEAPLLFYFLKSQFDSTIISISRNRLRLIQYDLLLRNNFGQMSIGWIFVCQIWPRKERLISSSSFGLYVASLLSANTKCSTWNEKYINNDLVIKIDDISVIYSSIRKVFTRFLLCISWWRAMSSSFMIDPSVASVWQNGQEMRLSFAMHCSKWSWIAFLDLM